MSTTNKDTQTAVATYLSENNAEQLQDNRPYRMTVKECEEQQRLLIDSLKGAKDIKCFKCLDSGYIRSFKDINGVTYEFLSKCDCESRDNTKFANDTKFADIPSIYKGIMLKDWSLELYQSIEGSRKAFSVKDFATSYVNKFSEMQKEHIGLYMWSNAKGSGKTRMCAAIANELIAKGVRVKFTTGSDILESFRESYDKEKGESEAQVLRRYVEPAVLIIDDLGQTGANNWRNNMFFNIINRRYEQGKVTLYTSNAPLGRLSGLGYDDRIVSRITGCSMVLEFPNESIRSLEGKAITDKFMKLVKKEEQG